jgi:hypothetical protein
VGDFTWVVIYIQITVLRQWRENCACYCVDCAAVD